MKCPIARVLTMALVLGLGTRVAPAQNWTSSVPLGDLARQLKAQRRKSEKKSKVFTNDDRAALLPGLASRARVTYELNCGDSKLTVKQAPKPTPLQARAYELVRLFPVAGN
jgi:hypothetical protein